MVLAVDVYDNGLDGRVALDEDAWEWSVQPELVLIGNRR